MNPQPKSKPYRNKQAIEWFRTVPCAVCGSWETTGHHEPLRGHGTGTKGPDNEQILLCFVHHRERHDTGKKTFYEKYFDDHWRDIVRQYKSMVMGAIKH